MLGFKTRFDWELELNLEKQIQIVILWFESKIIRSHIKKFCLVH